jgi:hypothetical protein
MNEPINIGIRLKILEKKPVDRSRCSRVYNINIGPKLLITHLCTSRAPNHLSHDEVNASIDGVDLVPSLFSITFNFFVCTFDKNARTLNTYHYHVRLCIYNATDVEGIVQFVHSAPVGLGSSK